MLTTKSIAKSNTVAQKRGAEARVLVDQAAVVIVDKSKVAASQASIAAKCVVAGTIGFVRAFIGK
jgi:hypothetical protein